MNERPEMFKESLESSSLGLEEKSLVIKCQEWAVISVVLMTDKLGAAALAQKIESTCVLVHHFLSNNRCSYLHPLNPKK